MEHDTRTRKVFAEKQAQVLLFCRGNKVEVFLPRWISQVVMHRYEYAGGVPFFFSTRKQTHLTCEQQKQQIPRGRRRQCRRRQEALRIHLIKQMIPPPHFLRIHAYKLE